jgi:hypothetical protein
MRRFLPSLNLWSWRASVVASLLLSMSVSVAAAAPRAAIRFDVRLANSVIQLVAVGAILRYSI